jgi:glycogen synthase
VYFRQRARVAHPFVVHIHSWCTSIRGVQHTSFLLHGLQYAAHSTLCTVVHSAQYAGHSAPYSTVHRTQLRTVQLCVNLCAMIKRWSSEQQLCFFLACHSKHMQHFVRNQEHDLFVPCLYGAECYLKITRMQWWLQYCQLVPRWT